MKFKPNWAQETILSLFWFFNLILKARQLGITTFFCILYLDQVLFKANKNAGIIAHTDGDTKKLFQRIKFAWENLPETLKENIGMPQTDTVGEMKFPNGSSIFVARSTRGSTLQYLHISEFAKICAKYPAKAREIVTGAINSVEQGNFVSIESTAEGRDGYFYDYCTEAQKADMEKRNLSPLDFRFFFFPWWKEDTYRLKAYFPITKEYELYFEKLQGDGITLDDEQKRWYMAKKSKNDEDMYREYPSTWQEAFLANIEGAYYAQSLQKVYADNRIRNVPWDMRYKVDTYWDLGMNDTNVIIFTQSVGNEIRIIDEYSNSGEGLAHYVNILREKGYSYDRHVFPHDVEVRNLDAEGKSRRQTLMDLGLQNIRTIEKTKDVNDDIEAVRKMFSRFYFDEAKTAKTIESLQNYKKEWDDKLGTFKNSPKHDKYSHFADVFRLIARGWNQHMVGPDKNEATVVNFF